MTSRRRLTRVVVTLAILLVLLSSAFVLVHPAAAKAALTPNPNYGHVLLSGSDWRLSGGGVDVMINGIYLETPYDGQWQCVELVNRLYKTKGWITSNWSGNANQMYGTAASVGLTSEDKDDSITSINPGDVIVLDGGVVGLGHVAIVDSVNGTTINVVSQNISQTTARSVFTWDRTNNKIVTKNSNLGTTYTTIGIVHAPGGSSSPSPTSTPPPSPSPSTPAAVARTSTSMDVFYNDGHNHIVGNFWNGTNGWTSGYWSDNNIAGQPTVTDRTSNNLDIFYRTTDGKLEYRAWTLANGWFPVVTMVPSGVSGDPWAISRGSNDMQVFFLYNSQQIASINWDINNGWNTTPQILYSSGTATDPVAISRNSNSMDVFFGKNIGNLVHLGWDPTDGWRIEDFSAGSGVDGRPTAIFRNGGNDMSAYYKEKNSGKVAEEFWDINNGWGWQDWNASLSGIPSAIPGISNTIDNFYRETGGNLVDRYFSACGWCTQNIVGTNGSTGNPTAIIRGSTSIEVFYWNGTSLMDDNWNTTSQSWNGGAKIN